MTYELKNQAVLWKGRKIRNADLDGFRVLEDERFACSGGTVWYMGKPHDCDVSSFAIVNRSYVKDEANVWHIVSVRLKLMSGVDTATFRAVGDWHACDNQRAYAGVKVIKGADPVTFREHGQYFCSDAGAIYHGHARFCSLDDKALKSSSLRLLPYHDSQYSSTPFIVTDSENAYYVSGSSLSYWAVVESGQPKQLRFVSTDSLFSVDDSWLTDGACVFWYGWRLPGVGLDELTIWSNDVLSTANAVYLGNMPLNDIDAESLACLGREIFADKSAIWRLKARYSGSHAPEFVVEQLTPFRRSQFDPEAACEAFLQAVIEKSFALFDVSRGVEELDSFYEVDTSQLGTKLPLHITVDGDSCTVTLRGATASGPISSWYRLAASLWGRSNEPGLELRHYKNGFAESGFGYSVPRYILAGINPEVLMAAESLLQSGYREEAHYLAMQRLRALYAVGVPDLQKIDDWELCATISPELLAHAGPRALYHEFVASTYLAGARQALGSHYFAEGNVAERWAVAAFLHYMAVETGQYKHFLREVAPAIISRLEDENVEFVRDQLLAALEAIARFGEQWFELRDEARPLLERLIAEGVNPAVNRRRLAGEL